MISLKITKLIIWFRRSLRLGTATQLLPVAQKN